MRGARFTINTLLALTAGAALLCAGLGVLQAAPFRSLCFFGVGGAVLSLAIFGCFSRPWQTAGVALLGALLLSLCYTIVFNLRSQWFHDGGPRMGVHVLWGTLLGGVVGSAATLPFLLSLPRFIRGRRTRIVEDVVSNVREEQA